MARCPGRCFVALGRSMGQGIRHRTWGTGPGVLGGREVLRARLDGRRHGHRHAVVWGPAVGPGRRSRACARNGACRSVGSRGHGGVVPTLVVLWTSPLGVCAVRRGRHVVRRGRGRVRVGAVWSAPPPSDVRVRRDLVVFCGRRWGVWFVHRDRRAETGGHLRRRGAFGVPRGRTAGARSRERGGGDCHAVKGVSGDHGPRGGGRRASPIAVSTLRLAVGGGPVRGAGGGRRVRPASADCRRSAAVRPASADCRRPAAVRPASADCRRPAAVRPAARAAARAGVRAGRSGDARGGVHLPWSVRAGFGARAES